MIRKARQDYIQLSYLYGGAIIVIVTLSLIAFPFDITKFGLIVPQKTDHAAIYTDKAFSAISVEAKSFIVYDIVDKKIIASKDADKVLPLASLTKIMTAVTALTHHDPNEKIKLSDLAIEGGYDLGLKKDQTWTLRELLRYTLVFSSNDGAYAIAHAFGGKTAFVKQMNTDAALLGLSLTFTNPAGLDLGGESGGMGTAFDVARLFAIARKLHPEILEATTHTRVSVKAGTTVLTGVPNTNQEINSFFGAEASKTGFTDNAGGNLAIVVDITLGHPVVIVVLGSTREGRFKDVEKLYQALVKSIDSPGDLAK
jgi:D-alanyl-D-alanine carboxypeptidase